MNKKYKIITIFSLLHLFLFSITVSSAEEVGIEYKEVQIIISELLHFYPEGLNNKEYIDKYHEWTDIVEKYNSKKVLNDNEFKVYLFIIFVAEKSFKTHSREVLANNIIKKFKENPERFLSIMKRHPFLRETTCKMIQRHYLLYDKVENTHLFAEKYNNLFIEYLGNKWGTICIESIKTRLEKN